MKTKIVVSALTGVETPTRDDALDDINHFVGDSKKIAEEYAHDFIGLNFFSYMVPEGQRNQTKFKIHLRSDEGAGAITLLLCPPTSFCGLAEDVTTLLVSHIIVDFFRDSNPVAITVYHHMEYSSIADTKITGYKYSAGKDVDLLSATTYFKHTKGFETTESLLEFKMEAGSKNLKVKSFSAIYEGTQNHFSESQNAKTMFTSTVDDCLKNVDKVALKNLRDLMHTQLLHIVEEMAKRAN